MRKRAQRGTRPTTTTWRCRREEETGTSHETTAERGVCEEEPRGLFIPSRVHPTRTTRVGVARWELVEDLRNGMPRPYLLSKYCLPRRGYKDLIKKMILNGDNHICEEEEIDRLLAQKPRSVPQFLSNHPSKLVRHWISAERQELMSDFLSDRARKKTVRVCVSTTTTTTVHALLARLKQEERDLVTTLLGAMSRCFGGASSSRLGLPPEAATAATRWMKDLLSELFAEVPPVVDGSSSSSSKSERTTRPNPKKKKRKRQRSDGEDALGPPEKRAKRMPEEGEESAGEREEERAAAEEDAKDPLLFDTDDDDDEERGSQPPEQLKQTPLEEKQPEGEKMQHHEENEEEEIFSLEEWSNMLQLRHHHQGSPSLFDFMFPAAAPPEGELSASPAGDGSGQVFPSPGASTPEEALGWW